MCLAVPGKIVSINGNNLALKTATADFAGVRKDICIEWLPDVKIGEYVLVHAGFALNKIDEEDAEESLKVLREMAESIDEEDLARGEGA